MVANAITWVIATSVGPAPLSKSLTSQTKVKI